MNWMKENKKIFFIAIIAIAIIAIALISILFFARENLIKGNNKIIAANSNYNENNKNNTKNNILYVEIDGSKLNEEAIEFAVEEEIEEENTQAEEPADNTNKNNGENNNDSKKQYYIKVNLVANTVTVYKNDGSGNYNPIKAMICSTGAATPTSGKYMIGEKYNWLLLFGDVYGHYCTRILTSAGKKTHILFHSIPYLRNNDNGSLEYWEFDKLGTSASMGCIRLQIKDTYWIYSNIPRGTIVEFYSDSSPGPLGKPSAQKISENVECRNWDPTDHNSENPWLKQGATKNEQKNETKDETKNENIIENKQTALTNSTQSNTNIINNVDNKVENKIANNNTNNIEDKQIAEKTASSNTINNAVTQLQDDKNNTIVQNTTNENMNVINQNIQNNETINSNSTSENKVENNVN